jgi:hypothetical protein
MDRTNRLFSNDIICLLDLLSLTSNTNLSLRSVSVVLQVFDAMKYMR